jgi:hypothetical protein
MTSWYSLPLKVLRPMNAQDYKSVRAVFHHRVLTYGRHSNRIPDRENGDSSRRDSDRGPHPDADLGVHRGYLCSCLLRRLNRNADFPVLLEHLLFLPP